MSEHARQLDKYLRKVEGGEEVLRARERELYPSLDFGPLDEKEIVILMHGAGAARRGTGELPKRFWELPWPEDPDASVRRALEEDRR